MSDIKNKIKPWPNVRGLKDFEWKRDTDEDIQNPEKRRYAVHVVFTKIEKDKAWYKPTDSNNPAGYYDEAIFQDENGIKEYTVARRLVKKFKIGDHLTIHVAGCCTIIHEPLLREERT